MLVDTHAHLWWDSYENDLEDVLERARNKGVTKIIAPATDLKTSFLSIELAKKYPGIIAAAVGIHPEELEGIRYQRTVVIKNLRKIIEENKEYIVAIGEVGTDANTEELRENMSDQKELFREQIELAQEFGLPIIVHTRNSLKETLEVLDYMKIMPKGQFHCFSYDEAGLREVLKRGFYVSFCGNLTWSKKLQKIAPIVPADKLLLETDSPFMMPRDKKGEPIIDSLRNEPANVKILAQLQAEIRNTSLEVLTEQVANNTNKLYKI